jgi:hypothetical protein
MMASSVAKPSHFNADPDPAFHFDVDPDPSCQFDPGPDLDPPMLQMTL